MLFLINERRKIVEKLSFPLDASQLLKILAIPINISFPIDTCLYGALSSRRKLEVRGGSLPLS